MAKISVYKARTSYRPDSLGSFDTTAYMLIKQHNFPLEYDDEKDKYSGADHDRVRVWYKDFHDIVKRHTGWGEMGIGDWVQKNFPEKVIEFLVDALHADRSVAWNGFRVMGSVHQGNGYPVFTLELFYKHPESDTVVYSGQGMAPNVATSNEDYAYRW